MNLVAVTVDVTATDIQSGKPGNCCMCPIALAVNRTLAVGLLCVSFNDSIMIRNDKRVEKATKAYLPREATDFIDAFDNLASVEPFSFTIDLPAKAVRRK
jgi:hypothetical protein